MANPGPTLNFGLKNFLIEFEKFENDLEDCIYLEDGVYENPNSPMMQELFPSFNDTIDLYKGIGQRKFSIDGQTHEFHPRKILEYLRPNYNQDKDKDRPEWEQILNNPGNFTQSNASDIQKYLLKSIENSYKKGTTKIPPTHQENVEHITKIIGYDLAKFKFKNSDYFLSNLEDHQIKRLADVLFEPKIIHVWIFQKVADKLDCNNFLDFISYYEFSHKYLDKNKNKLIDIFSFLSDDKYRNKISSFDYDFLNNQLSNQDSVKLDDIVKGIKNEFEDISNKIKFLNEAFPIGFENPVTAVNHYYKHKESIIPPTRKYQDQQIRVAPAQAITSKEKKAALKAARQAKAALKAPLKPIITITKTDINVDEYFEKIKSLYNRKVRREKINFEINSTDDGSFVRWTIKESNNKGLNHILLLIFKRRYYFDPLSLTSFFGDEKIKE